MPHVVDRVHRQLCFDLGERVPVAIVVVTRVGVIQLRRPGPLARRAQCAFIPARHDRHAVGIERREQEENHIVEDPACPRARVGREAVGEHCRSEVAAHLVGMDPGGDEYDRLALAQRTRPVRTGAQGPRVGEPGVQAPVGVELPQVSRARDHQRDERCPQSGLAQLAVVNPVARLRECLVVAHQERPVGELAIVTRLEAEH